MLAGDGAPVGGDSAGFDDHHVDAERSHDAVPFDAFDLPGYAVGLFDFGLAHPELVRLLQWHRPAVRRLATPKSQLAPTAGKARSPRK